MPNARSCICEMYHRRLQSFQCLVDAFIFSQQFEPMTGCMPSPLVFVWHSFVVIDSHFVS